MCFSHFSLNCVFCGHGLCRISMQYPRKEMWKIYHYGSRWHKRPKWGQTAHKILSIPHAICGLEGKFEALCNKQGLGIAKVGRFWDTLLTNHCFKLKPLVLISFNNVLYIQIRSGIGVFSIFPLSSKSKHKHPISTSGSLIVVLFSLMQGSLVII